MKNYTVETLTGKKFSVDSRFTDREAQNILAQNAALSDLYGTLLDSRTLTPVTRAWLHVLANQHSLDAEFEAVLTLLTRAIGSQKAPRVKIQ